MEITQLSFDMHICIIYGQELDMKYIIKDQ